MCLEPPRKWNCSNFKQCKISYLQCYQFGEWFCIKSGIGKPQATIHAEVNHWEKIASEIKKVQAWAPKVCRTWKPKNHLPVCSKLQCLLLNIKLLHFQTRSSLKPWFNHSSSLDQISQQLRSQNFVQHVNQTIKAEENNKLKKFEYTNNLYKII